MAALTALALAGCGGDLPNSAIDLFHGLEGGPIAAQRPPPPGADSPYPNLASIPARPPAPDVAAQQGIADRLAAQRDAAEAAAARDPLTPPPKPPPAPKPPAPDPNANKVTVDAAPAPARPAQPAPALSLASIPALQPGVAAGAMPDLAAAPPPAPSGLGVASPLPLTAAVTLPTAAPAAPAGGVAVAFTPGSTVLPPSATLRLRRFAQAHRGAALAVTGHADGGPADADAQSRALDLALRRAASIADALASAGVQPANLLLRAEASAAASSATVLN